MNIFEALRADHDYQRELLDELMETEGASDERKRIFLILKKVLSDHALAEERHFYVPLMKHDATQEKARHSVAEHHELDELVETLEKTDMSSAGWLANAKKLAHKLRHHLEEEEVEVFPLAGKTLNAGQKLELGESYRNEMGERADPAA